MASRPAQGRNSVPTKPPRPSYKPDNGTPKVVSRGTASRPTPLKKWAPKLLTTDATPKVTKR